MTQSQYPVAPPAPRPAGPGLGVSLVVGAVGLVVAIVSVVLIAIPLVGTFTSPVYSVPDPNGLHIHLHDARYTVYQRSGTSSGFGIDGDSSVPRIVPSEVTVTAPDGEVVPITGDVSDERISRGTAVYSSVLEFHPPVNGEYDIRFTNPTPAQVIIVRPLADAVASVGVWFATGALGGLLVVLGTVMLIVGATRRGRRRRAAYAGWGGPPGPGWYPPPGGQWGPPGAAPYPGQYPPSQYPPQYPPSQYPPAGYPPPPPPPHPTEDA